uniref:Ribosomal protein L6 n=1 Tax=Nitzschia sp. IriIs04 TaxID=1444690 RepID=A0A0S3QPN8_9STRA|nr:ribosomal protein L6 [Nitzschia sp. IriIs04]BAT70298.1 ribosomal protein L6 [Nitzschia sp. IriIs04]
MSRIGKKLISIPNNVIVVSYKNFIIVKGKYGILVKKIPLELKITQKDNSLIITLLKDTKYFKSLYGLYRMLIFNMIKGVSVLFSKTLYLTGVGYKASIKEKKLILYLGYSHIIEHIIPKDIFIEIIKNNIIVLKSIDNEKLGIFAAKIKANRYPDPYKGIGILFKNEKINYKSGKVGKNTK